MANVPVLTVNGLAIGETYHFVAGGGWQKTTPALDIYGPWGQNKSTALAATMPVLIKPGIRYISVFKAQFPSHCMMFMFNLY